ncbi:predicted protein [Chaetoceros tenuissimus]|uniref:Uncharacterized protein n=1 Tax=Chaetoceros tenuissimus TaxID=426638 RepID=A0AAD3DAV3_9STRA|nr:predicted protein [Chaetoceros tenuissimus]
MVDRRQSRGRQRVLALVKQNRHLSGNSQKDVQESSAGEHKKLAVLSSSNEVIKTKVSSPTFSPSHHGFQRGARSGFNRDALSSRRTASRTRIAGPSPCRSARKKNFIKKRAMASRAAMTSRSSEDDLCSVPSEVESSPSDEMRAGEEQALSEPKSTLQELFQSEDQGFIVPSTSQSSTFALSSFPSGLVPSDEFSLNFDSSSLSCEEDKSDSKSFDNHPSRSSDNMTFEVNQNMQEVRKISTSEADTPIAANSFRFRVEEADPSHAGKSLKNEDSPSSSISPVHQEERDDKDSFGNADWNECTQPIVLTSKNTMDTMEEREMEKQSGYFNFHNSGSYSYDSKDGKGEVQEEEEEEEETQEKVLENELCKVSTHDSEENQNNVAGLTKEENDISPASLEPESVEDMEVANNRSLYYFSDDEESIFDEINLDGVADNSKPLFDEKLLPNTPFIDNTAASKVKSPENFFDQEKEGRNPFIHTPAKSESEDCDKKYNISNELPSSFAEAGVDDSKAKEKDLAQHVSTKDVIEGNWWDVDSGNSSKPKKVKRKKKRVTKERPPGTLEEDLMLTFVKFMKDIGCGFVLCADEDTPDESICTKNQILGNEILCNKDQSIDDDITLDLNVSRTMNTSML